MAVVTASFYLGSELEVPFSTLSVDFSDLEVARMDQTKLLIAVVIGLAIAGGIIFLMAPSNSSRNNLNTEAVSGQYSDEEAAEYFNSQDWENAVLAYQAITGAEPENNVAWFRLANSLHSLERFEEAIPAYEQALQHGFFNLQVMLNLARVYSQMGDNDMAIDWLEQATDAGMGVVAILQNDDRLEGVRADARFAAVLEAAQQNAQPCEHDERFRQWDFWIGEWDVYDAQGNLVGSNTIEKIAHSCALLESWVNANGVPGNSINYYDVEIGKWRQYWVSSNGGTIPQEGEFRDGAMHTEGRNIGPDGSFQLFRGTWTPLEDGRVRQFLEQSTDNGQTWYTWFDGYYVRKESGESQSTQ